MNNICLNCGNIMKNISRGKFCSNLCHSEFVFNNKIYKWLSEEKFELNKSSGASNYIKRWLLKINKNKCQNCGWDKINETSKKCPLEIHHVDGDAYNNDISNLMILCPNCHSLTSNYKNIKKVKSKRTYRSKYYKKSLP